MPEKKKNKVSTLNKVIKEILNEEVIIKHWQQLVDASVNYIEKNLPFRWNRECKGRPKADVLLEFPLKSLF